jgi:hypothetical protein
VSIDHEDKTRQARLSLSAASGDVCMLVEDSTVVSMLDDVSDCRSLLLSLAVSLQQVF